MSEPKYDRTCQKCGAAIYQGVLCAKCHTNIRVEPAPSAATETPRTDSTEGSAPGSVVCCDELAELARQLERSLAAKTAELEEAKTLLSRILQRHRNQQPVFGKDLYAEVVRAIGDPAMNDIGYPQDQKPNTSFRSGEHGQ